MATYTHATFLVCAKVCQVGLPSHIDTESRHFSLVIPIESSLSAFARRRYDTPSLCRCGHAGSDTGPCYGSIAG